MQKIKFILAEQASQRDLSFEEYISEVRKCQKLMQSSLALMIENINLAHQIIQINFNHLSILSKTAAQQEIYEINNFDIIEVLKKLEIESSSTKNEEILEFTASKMPDFIASWDISREFTLKCNNNTLREALDTLQSCLVLYSSSLEEILALWDNIKQVIIFLDTFHYAFSAINSILLVVAS